MRQKYDDVRVFVPLAAMSAATMWCLASDQIVMGKHSQLGPIDPQIQMAQGMVPAAAIRRQFETAKEECAADPRKLSAWMPTLQQYFPGMVEICADAEKLGRDMVTEWLQRYMFRGDVDSAAKAERVAAFVSDDREHGSHGRGIHRDRLRDLGVNISDLEDDPALQDAVLSVYHATMHTLTGTTATKIVENHLGRSFVNVVQQIQMPMTTMPVPGP